MTSDSRGGSTATQSHVLTPAAWESLPPQVFAPLVAAPAEGDEQVQLELREVGAAGQALLVYSSLPELAAACGAEQAWMRIESATIPQLAEAAEFGTVLFDTAMPVPAVDELADGGSTTLYAPSRRYAPGDETAWLELQPVAGGQLALLVFSSLELLQAGCGAAQLWVSFPADQLPEVLASSGADVVFRDSALPEQVRWGAPGEQRSLGLSETGHHLPQAAPGPETGVRHTRSAGNGA